MKGKEKCKLLSDIRAQIAAANDIEWVTENCSHKGDCRGTCPKCESEVAALERALARRKSLGKTVAVAGLSAGLITSMASCGLFDSFGIGGAMVEDATTVTTSAAKPVNTDSAEVLEPGTQVGDYWVIQPVLYRAVESFTVTCFVDGMLSPDVTVFISEGEQFTVVSVCDKYLMIEYEENLCLLSDDDLHSLCEPVDPDQTIE